MPLSEHERRQLEQIEQALSAGDRRFAEAVHAADPRVHYRRRVIAAALGFVIGVGLLLAGVVINVIPVAVAGFVVMLACSLWAVTSYRRAARRQGRAGWQAGGIGADGAAGGTLAAPPRGRPLNSRLPTAVPLACGAVSASWYSFSVAMQERHQRPASCPGVAVRWGDVPGLSSFVGSWPPSWQQVWQQSARDEI